MGNIKSHFNFTVLVIYVNKESFILIKQNKLNLIQCVITDFGRLRFSDIRSDSREPRKYVRCPNFFFDFLFIFLVVSSTVCFICFLQIRRVSSVVFLRELLYSALVSLWKIGIANPPYRLGKVNSLRSSFLYIRPPVIAGIKQSQMVSSIADNESLISQMVFTWFNEILEPLTNAG